MISDDFHRAIHRMLVEPVERRAHDIYVGPMAGGGYAIELGIDGRVVPGFRITDPQRAQQFFTELKARTGCDMAQLGVPQDARFSLASPPVDYRVALFPTSRGEHLTLRILPRDRVFDLDAYPMHPDAKEALKAALQGGQGAIVLSGPTGSGKTTLLHQALSWLNDGSRAIYTIENPIEYEVDGLRQSEVTPTNSPADLLRAVLRQAPHVLMVGEIRDPTTATLAMDAVKTGHLMLTTVHAGRLDNIVPRLTGLGVDADDVHDNLAFASTQRLVPSLCPHCRVPDPAGAERIRHEQGVLTQAYVAEGCEACAFSGLHGRTLLMGWATAEGPVQTLRESAFDSLGQGAIDVASALHCL